MRHVVLLTIDALRMDALGCYGDENRLTPFIDSIQGNCIRFTKAHSVGPYTEAAIPGILTSSYYFEYGRQKQLSETVDGRFFSCSISCFQRLNKLG